MELAGCLNVQGYRYSPDDFFPYDTYREHQEELIQDIYEILGDRGHLIVSAPNGFGKTITCLSGLLPLAFNKDLKVFYCCRTHSQNQRVIDEALKINKGRIDSHVRILSLKGKANLCRQRGEDGEEFDVSTVERICQQRGLGKCVYYNKNKEWKEQEAGGETALDQFCGHLFAKSCVVDDGILKDAAEKEGLCPYFLSLEMVKFSNVVVCSYMWIFNPGIFNVLTSYAQVEPGDILVVVDEAHNLPSLAKQLLTTSLNEKEVETAIRDVELLKDAVRNTDDSGPRMKSLVQQDMERISTFFNLTTRAFVRMKELLNERIDKNVKEGKVELDGIETELPVDSMIQSLKNQLDLDDNGLTAFFELLSQLGLELIPFKLRRGQKMDEEEGQLSMFIDVAEFFLRLLRTKTDPAYCEYYTLTEKERWCKMESVGLDPYNVTQRVFSNVFASLSLSGTIDKTIYKMQCLREQDIIEREVPSPFGPAQVRTLFMEGISSQFTRRTTPMYEKYARIIVESVRVSPGNVGVFCVSKNFVKKIAETSLPRMLSDAGKILFVERPVMASWENKAMLDDFKNNGNAGRDSVLLGALGGRN